MLKNYTCNGEADKRSRKEVKVWQKSYELWLDIYNNRKIPKGKKIRSNFTDKKIGCFYSFKYSRRDGRKKIMDYIRKQTLESLNPGILEPSSPTKLEKNRNK